MNTTIHQRVMKYAHHIHRTLECEWSEALLRGWEMHYLRQMLAHGVVEFSFIKRDGSTRTARGTNNLDIIPPSKHPKGNGRTVNYQFSTINYYDLDKEAWRAFSVERFIQVTRVMAIRPVERIDHAWAM